MPHSREQTLRTQRLDEGYINPIHLLSHPHSSPSSPPSFQPNPPSSKQPQTSSNPPPTPTMLSLTHLTHITLTILTFSTTTFAISRADSRAIYERELVARSGCLYSNSPTPCTTCLGGPACNEGVGPVANGGNLGW